MYFFGVAHALVRSDVLQRWESEGTRVRFCGSSVGALVATCLACGEHDFEAVMEHCLRLSTDFRASWMHIFSMRRYLEDSINLFGRELRKLDDAEDRVYMREMVDNGRLEIAVTTLPWLRSKLLKGFQSYSEIKEALIASCCIVPLLNMPFKMKSTGDWVVDGAVASFTPRIAERNCISVSPMYFQDASVRPHTFVPSWWALRPPSEARYRSLFWMGYNDMLDFLVVNGLLSQDTGTELIRPESDLGVLETYWDLAFTIFMECTMLIWVRPVMAVCIYVELFISYVTFTLRNAPLSAMRLAYNTLKLIANPFSFFPLFRLVSIIFGWLVSSTPKDANVTRREESTHESDTNRLIKAAKPLNGHRQLQENYESDQ